jgi:serine/threonine protein phosphatase PrpC
MLLAVSDGMGGAEAGEVASALTVASLTALLGEDVDTTGTRQLKNAVEVANRNVFEASQQSGRQGMGATLTAALVRGQTAHVAAVGDSRAYLLRAGQIRQLTRDQSYVEMLLETGLVTREQAERSPYRNVILQAMGKRPDISVAIGKVALRRGDRLLICSDGLSSKVGEPELLAVVSHNARLDSACGELIELAKARGGEDNITVLIAELDGAGLLEAGAEERITRTLTSVAEFDLRRGARAATKPPEPAAQVATPVAQPVSGGDTVRELTPLPVSSALPAAEPVQAVPTSAAAPPRGRWIHAVLIAMAIALVWWAVLRLLGYELDPDYFKDIFD